MKFFTTVIYVALFSLFTIKGQANDRGHGGKGDSRTDSRVWNDYTDEQLAFVNCHDFKRYRSVVTRLNVRFNRDIKLSKSGISVLADGEVEDKGAVEFYSSRYQTGQCMIFAQKVVQSAQKVFDFASRKIVDVPAELKSSAGELVISKGQEIRFENRDLVVNNRVSNSCEFEASVSKGNETFKLSLQCIGKFKDGNDPLLYTSGVAYPNDNLASVKKVLEKFSDSTTLHWTRSLK